MMSEALIAEIDRYVTEGADGALDRVAMALVAHVGDVAAIARFDGDTLEPVAFGHRDPDALSMLRASYPPTSLSESRMAQLLLRAGEPVLIPKIDPREFQTLSGTAYARERGVYSIAMALVRDAAGKPRGLVSISREHPGAPYGEQEKQLVAAVAERVAPLLTQR